MKRAKQLKLIFIVLFLIANLALLEKVGLFEIVISGSRAMIDFDHYHRTAVDLLAGQHPYRASYGQTLGPPLVLAVFLPFGFFSLERARSLLTILNLFSVFFLAYILARRFYPNQKLTASLFLSLLLLSSFTARFSLLMGQPILIATLLLTIFLVSKKPYLRGVCLAGATVIKTFLGFGVLPLVKVDKKALIWFFVFLLGITLLCSPIIKPGYYVDYFKERFLQTTFSPARPENLDYYNQSLKSTLFRLEVGELYPFVYPILLILAGGYLIVTGNLEASVVLSILISPVCWQHYFVMLFPIMVILFKKIFAKPKFLLLLGLSFLLWWIEIPSLHKAPINFINGILASHFFLSAIILLFLIIWEESHLS